ncbi:hypothetical protein AALO_G00060910 [Alosa alosa]|uniref:Uncharacterized protein n=1 Tax=Alosa alosa TaxID=278164 RepID=A0AAV6H0F7_9TELE|nr:hypothetical protein AALO_G00060910 [Alosa alosa]
MGKMDSVTDLYRHKHCMKWFWVIDVVKKHNWSCSMCIHQLFELDKTELRSRLVVSFEQVWSQDSQARKGGLFLS